MKTATTLIIPTVGRIPLLRDALDSVQTGSIRPSQLVLVDQSEGEDVARLAKEFPSLHIDVISVPRRGVGAAMNTGLASALHSCVLVTHDDCRVASHWLERGTDLFDSLGKDTIVTGQVLRPAGVGYVPSTKEDPVPRDFSGPSASVLYPNNMVLSKETALAIGFDERPGLARAAEDNDFCLRWLRSGRRICYRPEMQVWHHDWREPRELIKTHKRYGRAQGVLYAKHLHLNGCDRITLSLMKKDVQFGARGLLRRVFMRSDRSTDPDQDMLLPFFVGLCTGGIESIRLGKTSAWRHSTESGDGQSRI